MLSRVAKHFLISFLSCCAGADFLPGIFFLLVMISPESHRIALQHALGLGYGVWDRHVARIDRENQDSREVFQTNSNKE